MKLVVDTGNLAPVLCILLVFLKFTLKDEF